MLFNPQSDVLRCRSNAEKSTNPRCGVSIFDLYSSIGFTIWVKMADESTPGETFEDVNNKIQSISIDEHADSPKTAMADAELDELLDSTCWVSRQSWQPCSWPWGWAWP